MTTAAPLTAEEPPATPAVDPDVGDRVFVAVWRPVDLRRVGEPAGAWSWVLGRVLGVSRDGTKLSYETDSNPAAEYDTPTGSRIRFARTEHVFDNQAAADSACRALPDPN